MIALKKLYSNELLRLALILSLLKSDPNNNVLIEEQRIVAGLNTGNGSDWSLEDDARTLVIPDVLQTKSLDNILFDYERQVFEELNSLGRNYDSFANYLTNNHRILNINEPVLQTYVVNNFTTEIEASVHAYDPVTDDLNVAREEELSTSDADEVKVESVTVSEGYLHNATQELVDIPEESFDVADFFVEPPKMHFKREPEADVDVNIKKELAEDEYLKPFDSDDDQYDLFEEVDKVAQSVMEISEYDQTLETLREFRVSMDYLDLKQEMDLDQFLMENMPLDVGEITMKRERGGTSFTSTASSSGVSDVDDDISSEGDRDGRLESSELSQEDVDLIEVLWKQDVDMGFSRDDAFGLVSELEAKVALDTAFEPTVAKNETPSITKPKEDEFEVKEKKTEDPWEGLSYIVDTETGEYILQGDLPTDLVTEEEGRFDLLEEALKLVDLDDSQKSIPDTKKEQDDSSKPLLNPTTTEEPEAADMLHPAAPRPHPHHPHPHHHTFYHPSLMRQMSTDQRWQDLASLLTAPPPPPSAVDNPYHHHQAQHHHYNLTAPHHATSGGYANYPPPPPHMPPPPAIEKHHNPYCGAMDADFKMEAAAAAHHSQHEPLYYQQPDLNGTSDGFLSSILNDEDLQLMDMAVNEGMYTMRMLDGTPVAQHPPAPNIQHHPYTTLTNNVNERADSGSDSAVSSMGSERVASLSDGEWCDDASPDYTGSKFRPYESSGQYGRNGTERAGPSAPQKKHHMFGKRCFQESMPTQSEPMHLERSLRPPVKYEYTEMTPAYDQQIHAQADYASRLTQSNALATGHPSALNPDANILNSTMLHPMQIAGPTVDRVRHNHTYSGPPHPHTQLRPHSRDKKLKRLSEGSSDGGHTSRDERRAKALGIPIDVNDIINLPMDEFNERLSKHDLSEAQLSLIRDIRRRGKNKVAAQNCRKRKLDQITSLADEVRTVRERKARLTRERHAALLDRQRIKDRFAALYRHVFQIKVICVRLTTIWTGSKARVSSSDTRNAHIASKARTLGLIAARRNRNG